MTVVVVTAPSALVTLAEVKQHLNILHSDDDALLTGLIAAVSQHLDGPGRWLGRAVGEQVLEWTISAFPERDDLPLPFTPAIEVISIEYDATDDSEQTWPAEQYRLHGGRVLPGFGRSWPTARCDPLAVRIRYRAGSAEVPAAVRVAVLMMVADLFARREPVSAMQLAELQKSGPVLMLLARDPNI